jgi:hypothetical protein
MLPEMFIDLRRDAWLGLGEARLTDRTFICGAAFADAVATRLTSDVEARGIHRLLAQALLADVALRGVLRAQGRVSTPFASVGILFQHNGIAASHVALCAWLLASVLLCLADVKRARRIEVVDLAALTQQLVVAILRLLLQASTAHVKHAPAALQQAALAQLAAAPTAPALAAALEASVAPRGTADDDVRLLGARVLQLVVRSHQCTEHGTSDLFDTRHVGRELVRKTFRWNGVMNEMCGGSDATGPSVWLISS